MNILNFKHDRETCSNNGMKKFKLKDNRGRQIIFFQNEKCV